MAWYTRSKNWTSAHVLFYPNNNLTICYIMDIKLHPEYYQNVFNTIALIFLKCTYNYWSFIILPKETYVYGNDNMLIKGLKDYEKGFSENTYIARKVNKSDCLKFYTNEELDYKSLWPRNVICVKADVRSQCVFDAGMALVQQSKRASTLIGISILGPGCSLPSRFIPLLPYIQWINENLPREIKTRRKGTENETKSLDMPGEELDKEDDFVIEKLNDTIMVLRPDLAQVTDKHGECTDIDGDIMYKDEGRLDALGLTAVGTYVFSLYDIYYEKITCVMVRVSCTKRTPSKLWYDIGFHQEDLDPYIQTVPMYKRNQTVPPKVLFVKERYSKHEKFKTAHIVFKFLFSDEAKILVEFYGRKTTTAHPLLEDYLD